MACDRRVIEAEERTAYEKALRLKEAEAAQKREDELRASLSSALEVEKKAHADEVEAHRKTKDQVSQLVADEREKAVIEYLESDELGEEVAGLFRKVYIACLDKVKELYPSLDLSGAALPSDADDEGDNREARVELRSTNTGVARFAWNWSRRRPT
ncbi:hypothetical protein Taro_031026 [Colocasia esculenta]|uniref:Uncharacterized protein n=1 Tax=Colocasia esculenta TaxID=4460 RepID=A0A843VHU9_COLES|nr:hypothetical protein [Colocasia esculenta]